MPVSTWERFLAGLGAFRKEYMTSGDDEFDEFRARRQRYALLWALYEGNSYDDTHLWSATFKQEYGLYTVVRNIFNPAGRLATFYADHLFGGQLDPEAGETGAIPIATESESLRPSIAELWRWSRWNVNKDTLTIQGTVYGNAVIQVVDDVTHRRVYLNVVKPELFREIELDAYGAVKSYVIQEQRDHPEREYIEVTYTEECTREGDDVVYQTYMDGAEYAWPENTNLAGEPASRWSLPYGFCPTVLIRHNDVGDVWGWSEFHQKLSKILECDEVASLISDAVRASSKFVWGAFGIKQPATTRIPATTATAARPYPTREEIVALWDLPTDGRMEPLVADMNVDQWLLHLNGILEELERDCPELQADIHTASGDASGRALRVARQRVIGRVLQRRANYDEGMVRAIQMGLSVGGFRGYEGYQGITLESYAQGALDLSVADRPVFEADPESESECELAFWTATAQAVATGVSLDGYLRSQGWDESRITELGIREPEPTEDEEEPNDES